MKYNIFIMMLVFAILVNGCCEEKNQERMQKLDELCKVEFLELHIVTTLYQNNKIHLLRIRDKKIITEFKRILTKKTFIAGDSVLRFSRHNYITIKTSTGNYTLCIDNRTHDSRYHYDIAHIGFYDEPNFDVADNFYAYKSYGEKSINDFFMKKYRWDFSCYSIRNMDLLPFIEKYIEGVVRDEKGNPYGIEVKHNYE